MKTTVCKILLALIPCLSSGQVTYEFGGKGDIFDNQTQVTVTIPNPDDANSILMNVGAEGGTFNSNAGDFGIGDDLLDGTTEVILISFDRSVDITALDFGGITDADDAAHIQANTTPPLDLNLFTGIADFQGTQDIYTPSTPIRLEAGQILRINGASLSASFDLESISFNVIPEVSAQNISTGATALTLVMMARFFR